MKRAIHNLARAVLPGGMRRWLLPRVRGWRCRPAVGFVRWGSLRRVEPISRNWGAERGRPVDRYYVEQFLAAHRADIAGRVLEIGDAAYTRAYGGDRVTQSDVLHHVASPGATFVGDLTRAEQLPSDAFDCVVLTQTLQFIYDVRAAIGTVHRILRPAGVVLATAPGISHNCNKDPWDDFWCWSFTRRSMRLLFEEHFPPGQIAVETRGNVLSATAFLMGLATEELRARELEHHDPNYPLCITVRAQKQAPEQAAAPFDRTGGREP